MFEKRQRPRFLNKTAQPPLIFIHILSDPSFRRDMHSLITGSKVKRKIFFDGHITIKLLVIGLVGNTKTTSTNFLLDHIFIKFVSRRQDLGG